MAITSVFIGIPTYRGVQCAPFAKSVAALVDRLNGARIKVTVGTTNGLFIPMARAEIVRTAIASNADKLLFLDDDVEFDPDDAIRLLQIDRPLVAGIYPIKVTPEKWPVIVYVNEDNTPKVDSEGLISARFVPMGFTAISIVELVKMCMHYKDRYFTHEHATEGTVTCYDLFPSGLHDHLWFTEDYAFCRLWKDIGKDIYVMPDCTLRHHNLEGKVWEGNYHKMLMACPKPKGNEAI